MAAPRSWKSEHHFEVGGARRRPEARAEFLASKHPRLRIVCDTKTMDAGRVESEAAAKAGAHIATVLAGASDATHSETASRRDGIMASRWRST